MISNLQAGAQLAWREKWIIAGQITLTVLAIQSIVNNAHNDGTFQNLFYQAVTIPAKLFGGIVGGTFIGTGLHYLEHRIR